jgi:hypothetical protein
LIKNKGTTNKRELYVLRIQSKKEGLGASHLEAILVPKRRDIRNHQVTRSLV